MSNTVHKFRKTNNEGNFQKSWFHRKNFGERDWISHAFIVHHLCVRLSLTLQNSKRFGFDTTKVGSWGGRGGNFEKLVSKENSMHDLDHSAHFDNRHFPVWISKNLLVWKGALNQKLLSLTTFKVKILLLVSKKL